MYLFGDITEILACPSASVIYAAVAIRGIRLDLGEGGVGAIVQGGVLDGETVTIDLRLRRPLYRSQNPRIPGPVLNGLAAALRWQSLIL